jgi:hypothetical protein
MKDYKREDSSITTLKDSNLFHPIMTQIIDSKFMNSQDWYASDTYHWEEHLMKLVLHLYVSMRMKVRITHMVLQMEL